MLNDFKEKARIIMRKDEENDVILSYICPTVGGLGFFLYLISFVVFSNPEFKEVLYKYLKMESLSVLLDLLITSIKPIYYCRTCSVSRTYFSQVYFIGFIVYGASILEQSAIINRILSTLCCLMLLRNKIGRMRMFFAMNSYKIISLFVFFSSATLFSYQVFMFEIVLIEKEILNVTICEYTLEKSEFSKTRIKTVLEISAFLIRDGINLIILIVLNSIIFLRFRNELIRKKVFFKPTNSNLKVSIQRDELVINIKNLNLNTLNQVRDELVPINASLLNRIKKSQNKQAIMVIITCLSCCIGRIPILIFFILRNFDNEEKYHNFTKLAILAVYLSYILNVYLYYHIKLELSFLWGNEIALIQFGRSFQFVFDTTATKM
ncbi:unnamed protein product [Brachionus calyciflorus]|uniref:Uncharacterized protein n=1 Tax=Brachionus calyciflorus TaxID=104777 RepID=A0A813S845_9BILA|nr:unnamed protein product [Brachionus calyciflorus]